MGDVWPKHCINSENFFFVKFVTYSPDRQARFEMGMRGFVMGGLIGTYFGMFIAQNYTVFYYVLVDIKVPDVGVQLREWLRKAKEEEQNRRKDR